MMDLRKISELLPDGFSFYEMGSVAQARSRASELRELIQDKNGVMFKLLGEPAAILIVLFDRALDVSMYSELGNILASQLCQRLSELGEGDLMITPPLVLKPEQLGKLALMNSPFTQKSYEHRDGEKAVVIETLILPLSAEGQVGHA